MIEIKNITRYHGKTAILKNITISVEKGKCLVLLGPSGSGKTSLLRIIAGLDRPHGGEILMCGNSISTPENIIGPEARNMSMIFQSLALWPHMTAMEHIRFVMKGSGKTGNGETKGKAQDLLDRMHLAGRGNRYPHQLSGGERQRLTIARALASRPGCLLMDEPFSNLDELLKDELMALTLREKKARNMTVVYVTHDVDEAITAADAMAVLRRGRIRKRWSGSEIQSLARHEILTYFAG
jgi:iron(III) transport system ATP-binding protein